MVFNTLTVGAAVTPSVIETYFSHFLHRGPLRQKPTAHISYHEGLRLIREFLDYSSKHSVEDLQAFTGQWVPAPHWVRINDAEIAPKFLERASRMLQEHLGHRGMERLGGRTWWQWRRPESPLRAEWIEMKKEYHERKRTGEKCERCILYIHGGAYYFGSVDEHRYQMQRHARKLRARVLSPKYRLAPQFPFPCGLFDCLATYLYLLEHFEPNQILFAGDSAGGGMVLSMLVILRDQGLPLPAGTILLSPWVDLTHSFPSVAGDGIGDYIPPHGFHHKPSMAWPPPPSDGTSGNDGAPHGVIELPAAGGLGVKLRRKPSRLNGQLDNEDELSALPTPMSETPTALPAPRFGVPLKMTLDGKRIEMKEQIQLYTTNELLAHPLVSPVLQPSLGGLPPMLIQVGGAELLRDEQIYLAHKAANPKEYPPSDTIMDEFDPERRLLTKYPPTNVQLQLWEDLCHVPHTLSFTRPAKYMYRSVAQFGAWALAHAQHRGIEIQNDDTVSIISSGDEDDDAKSVLDSPTKGTRIDSLTKPIAAGAVGKAGDPLPLFKDNMIRQRVTRHGIIYALAPVSEISALALDPASIGIPKPGPVRKWLAARTMNDQRFTNERKKIDKKRAKEGKGYDIIQGERPPATALVNRQRKGVAIEEKKKGKSWGLAMWSGWGSSHDEHTLQREQKIEKPGIGSERKGSVGNALETGLNAGGMKARRASSVSVSSHLPWGRGDSKGREKSPFKEVKDTGQAGEDGRFATGNQSSPALASASLAGSEISRQTSATDNMVALARPVSYGGPPGNDQSGLIPTTAVTQPGSERIPGSNTYLSPTSSRPHNGIQAYPFKLKDRASNPSIATLDSQLPSGAVTPSGVTHGGVSQGTSTSHTNELAGDAPIPVELPTERSTSRQGELAAQDNSDESDPPGSSSTTTAQTDASSIPKPSGTDDAGANTDVTDDPVSPIADTPTQQKAAMFKIRNPVFDQRTSMLGSLGADGMPNAHHAFSGDSENDSARPARTPSPANARKPFKLRHTVYEPNVTLGKPVTQEEIPEQTGMPPPGMNIRTPKPRASYRESGTLGLTSDQPRIVGEQRPPSYDNLPSTNVTIPELVPRRPVVRQAAAQEDEGNEPPPTPPPKDEKHLMKSKSSGLRRKKSGASKAATSKGATSAKGVKTDGSATGANTPDAALNTSALPTKYNAAPPVIGDLSFENIATSAEEKMRPPLESFVTAREASNI